MCACECEDKRGYEILRNSFPTESGAIKSVSLRSEADARCNSGTLDFTFQPALYFYPLSSRSSLGRCVVLTLRWLEHNSKIASCQDRMILGFKNKNKFCINLAYVEFKIWTKVASDMLMPLSSIQAHYYHFIQLHPLNINAARTHIEFCNSESVLII